MLHEIYLVTNLVNGKQYIGQTKQGHADGRWKEHNIIREDYNTIFHNAIKKYGTENFSVEVIEDNISDENGAVSEK